MYSRQPITWRTNPSRLASGTSLRSPTSSARASTRRGEISPMLSPGVSSEWKTQGVAVESASS